VTPLLDICSIAAGYGSGPVVRDVSLSVREGETFGLIGLNGAGKTTLLKTILGLKDPETGAITIGGAAAGSLAAKKKIGFLPERFDPAWFLNAYEFIDFTLSLYGHRAARADIDAMADRLGLARAYLSKKAQSYSKGMRQKLGLMTSFMTDCPFLILDEPMSGLDPLARAQVKDIMVQERGKGRTILLSSHILSDMEEICDRIAILHEGRLMFTGTPAELLAQTGQEQLERAFLVLIGAPLQAAA